MILRQHSQSLSDFRANAVETITRLNQTGEAEPITVDGEVRAILVSPALFDELTSAREVELERDATAIRRARQEFAEGKGLKVSDAFAQLRASRSDEPPESKAAR